MESKAIVMNQLLWDLSLQTDHKIEARRPTLLIIGKKEKGCQIINTAISVDERV